MSAHRTLLAFALAGSLAGCGSTSPSPTPPVSQAAPDWSQWGRDERHAGQTAAAGQDLSRLVTEITHDPFVPMEAAESGAVVVHYPAPLIAGDDVFMSFKTGRYVPCNPPGSRAPAPCGPDAWQNQVWNLKRLRWQGDTLSEVWSHESDWKPVPNGSGPNGWEPVFHAVLAGGFVYVPEARGGIARLDRTTGSVLARIDPFGDPSTYVAGALAADAAGNVYYDAVALDPASPWGADVRGAWLVKVGADGRVAMATFASLTPGAPQPGDGCELGFPASTLPWPPSPDAVAPRGPCGSQRPGLNVAPAIAADGTVYTVSRAHFNGRHGYLVAADASLRPKWAASLRDRLADGCGSDVLPPTGSPGGCRAGAAVGVDPETNAPPAARVVDSSSSSPVVAPDGSVLYGAYTRYNSARGHLLRFGPDGSFLASFDFGWDVTPAIYAHGGSYSVIVKDNHYDAGSYCGSAVWCPAPEEGPFKITQLSPALQVEWSYTHTNTLSCSRNPDNTLACVSDHPNGNEWCINAPVVDRDGVVYGINEDGNVYAIRQGGSLKQQLFLYRSVGAAYTPLAIGGDGRIYAQNYGRLFVVGR